MIAVLNDALNGVVVFAHSRYSEFSFDLSRVMPSVNQIVSIVLPIHRYGLHLAAYKEYYEGKEAVSLYASVENRPLLPNEKWIYVNWPMLLNSLDLLILELYRCTTHKFFCLLRRKVPPPIEKSKRNLR